MTAKKKTAKGKKPKAKEDLRPTTGSSRTYGTPPSAIPRKRRVPAHVKAAADRAEARAMGRDPDDLDEEEATKKATKRPAKKEGTKATKGRADRGAAKAAAAAEAAFAILDSYEPKLLGRPPKYKPEFAMVARVLCKRGATDYEIAEELGVSTRTVIRWKVAHEDFCQALKVHKEDFDAQIERSLALRANGFTIETEKVFCTHGRITRAKVLEYIPPDVGAAKLWLTNRRPDKWRDKTSTELTGKDGGAIEIRSTARERVAQRLAKLKEKS